MLNRIQDRKFYFILTSAFMLVAASLLIMFPEGRSFFIINGIHHPFMDMVFSKLTYLGDGLTFAIVAGVLMLFYRTNAGFTALIGLGLTGLTVFILKTYVFIDSQRPLLHFYHQRDLIHAPETYTNIEHSFPSGHSLTAFTCFTFLVLLNFGESVAAQIFFALLAILAAYSRVYLAHHFVGDILAGAVFGVLYGILLYAIYTKLKRKKFLNKSLPGYLNRSKA